VAAGGLACTCAFAAVHPESICGQFDRDGVFCVKLAADPPHGPHRDGPIKWIRVSSLTVTTSSASITGDVTVSRPRSSG